MRSKRTVIGYSLLLTIFLLSIILNTISNPYINNSDVYKIKIGNPRSSLHFTDDNSFLPGTNLSVTEYLDGARQNTFNMSIQELNFTHLKTRCDYSITQDLEGNPIPPTFYPIINRTSKDVFYHATGYYGWTGVEQDAIDYWLNTSSFQTGLILDFEGVNLTIDSSEVFTLVGVGTFDAWKLTGLDPLFGNPMTFRYAKDSGIFLTLQMQYFASIIQYNLTLAEFAQIPIGYLGPELSSITPQNNSVIPSSTIIEGEFQSDFNVYSIEYSWNDQFVDEIDNSAEFITVIPAGSGIHTLVMNVTDHLNIRSEFIFSFTVDDSLPGINPIGMKNGSRIQGDTELSFHVINSNGSLIYNWDNLLNFTVVSNGAVLVDNELIEGPKYLYMYVKSPAGFWITKRYLFIIDNTNPVFSIHNFENNTNLRGPFTFFYSVSESSITNISINSVVVESVVTIIDTNYTFTVANNENGTFSLEFLVVDEANNSILSQYLFFVQINSFEWNYVLKGGIPKTIPILDDYGDLMMYLSLASSQDQFFNISLLDSFNPPVVGDSLFLIQIQCQSPETIQYTRLVFELPTSSIDVFEWRYFDESSNTWLILPTAYNMVDHTWESLNEGLISYFSLISTGETTQLRSVELGGGQIPGFEFYTILITLVLATLINQKKTKKRK